MNEKPIPLVTVLVAHHLDANRGYLDLALKSLLATTGIAIEIICLADSETCPEVPEKVTLVYDGRLDNATKKMHRGVKMAHPDSQYLLFMSDDVVVTKDTISRMVYDTHELPMIVGPMCNGDNGSRYLTDFYRETKEGCTFLPVTLGIEDLKGEEDLFIQRFDTLRGTNPHNRILIRQDWLCFYLVLIPKTVWEKVGLLDETLDCRYNDVDYCQRAARLGISCYINANAFCLHFGSKTLPQTVKPGEADLATQHFYKKQMEYHISKDPAVDLL